MTLPRKFLTVVELTVSEYFVYRLSFLLWRFRNLLNLLLIYFLWTSVFTMKSSLFSYTSGQLVTYLLTVSFCSAVVLSTRTHELAGDILSGDIINYLLRPYSLLMYLLAKETADKFLNITMSMIEIILLLTIFRPDIAIHPSVIQLFAAGGLLLLGMGLSFMLSLLLSFIAFWTTEVWGPRFMYVIIITFLSGTLFPLDILPRPIYLALLATPFPYLIYFPAKVLVKGTGAVPMAAVGIALLWCAVLYGLIRMVWNKAMTEFSFYGK